jgi:hypothetical protein
MRGSLTGRAERAATHSYLASFATFSLGCIPGASRVLSVAHTSLCRDFRERRVTGEHTGRIAPQLKHLASLGGSPDVTTILSTPLFHSSSCSRRLKQVLGPTATFNTLINASHLRQDPRKGSQRPTYERDHVKPITEVNIVGCTVFQDLHTSVFWKSAARSPAG